MTGSEFEHRDDDDMNVQLDQRYVRYGRKMRRTHLAAIEASSTSLV